MDRSIANEPVGAVLAATFALDFFFFPLIIIFALESLRALMAEETREAILAAFEPALVALLGVVRLGDVGMRPDVRARVIAVGWWRAGGRAAGTPGAFRWGGGRGRSRLGRGGCSSWPFRSPVRSGTAGGGRHTF